MSVGEKKGVYRIEEYGLEREVVLKYGTYLRGHTLSASLYCRSELNGEESSFTELYDTITVNLPESRLLPDDTQFVDTNNHPDIGSWLILNQIAEPVDICVRSGYCVYPAYRFLDKVACSRKNNDDV